MWYYVGVIYLLSPCLYFIHPFSPRFSEMRKNGGRKSNPSGCMALAVSWIEIVNSESFGFRVGILQLSSPRPILMCNGLITVMTWWMDHTSQVTKALFPGKGILPRGVPWSGEVPPGKYQSLPEVSGRLYRPSEVEHETCPDSLPTLLHVQVQLISKTAMLRTRQASVCQSIK